MAALPSPTQVAGGHSAIYEAYYQQVDPSGSGSIPAQVAAKFLKKSGLSDIILSRIWDLSDPAGKGYLNKQGLFVALKLVALAQAGKALNLANMSSETAPPKIGELPNVLPSGPARPAPPGTNTGWAVQPAEKMKYDKLFDSLEPVNGLIQGNKVKSVMMNSKLPLPTLGKIWDLADADKDGMLDKHEFTVAMHLVYKALEKHAIPATLPPDLQKPTRPPIPVAPMGVPNRPALPPMPVAAPLAPSPIPAAPKVTPTFTSPHTVHWVVGPADRNKYEPRFKLADKDQDGFVSGVEIKDIFLQSGVPPPILAHIWGLCDTNQVGKLNMEQFLLAMWLVEQKLKGVNPPQVLTPDMVPPCMRPKPPPQLQPVVEVVNVSAGTPYQSTPELDMISKDIAELAVEKRTLESDIAQREADIKIKSGEIKSLQSELDTLAATLKQLENQKGEAQKRLNDLKGQKSSLEKEVTDIKLLVGEEQSKVAMLRSQADEQERTLKDQEDELHQRKQELDNLKAEETRLESSLKNSEIHHEELNSNLQETHLLISQAKVKISQLEDQKRQMDDAIVLFDKALTNNDAYAVPDNYLEPISTDFRDAEIVKFAEVNGTPSPSETKSADPFASTNGPVADSGFESKDNAFGNDQFASDPFAANFDSQQNAGFTSDPFANFGNSDAKSDPFADPFGEKTAASRTPEPGADAFGCDPFANSTSPALTPSPGPPAIPPQPGREDSSPTPALPPKKSKQPPPRPAPPKAMLRAAPQPAAPTSPSPEPNADPFGGADAFSNNDAFSSNSGGFANFADFDKFSSVSNNNNNNSNGISRHSHSITTTTTTTTTNNNNNNNSYASSSGSSSTAPSPAPPAPARPKGRYAGLEFTEDPFRDYRYEDPFDIEDPFASLPAAASTPATPASNNNHPVDAWASETERQKKLREQEQADYEFALALSKTEAAGS